MLASLKAAVRRRFPALGRAWDQVREKVEARRLSRLSAAEVFTRIHRDNAWGNAESRSGAGSTLAYTESLRAELPALLRRLEVRTLLDLPCGDFHWLRHLDLGLDRYIGGDIVPALIDRLRRDCAAPGREFQVLDLIQDPLPAADALLCRDCLVHLSNRDALAALANIRRGRARWLIATTFPEVTKNRDIATGQFRPVNLCLPPFNLPPPVESIRDTAASHLDRWLGVWRMNVRAG
jgi:hypothetical protein